MFMRHMYVRHVYVRYKHRCSTCIRDIHLCCTYICKPHKLSTHRGAGAKRPPLCMFSPCEVCRYMCSINVCRVYMCCIYACTAHILVARTCVAWTCSSGVQICQTAFDFSYMLRSQMFVCLLVLAFWTWAILEQTNIDFLSVWRNEGCHETRHSRFIPFGFVFQEVWLESFILVSLPRAIGNFKSRLRY